MTEWNNPTELGEVTSTSKPCAWCPMHTWGYLHAPESRELEKQIRADERLRFQRTFDMWAIRLAKAEAETERLRQQLADLRKTA